MSLHDRDGCLGAMPLCDDGSDNDGDGRRDCEAINGSGVGDARCNSPGDRFEAF